MRLDAYPYGLVAFCYDELAEFYSLGAIRRSKAHHLHTLSSGDRVLYAGVGRGADALAAARLGVQVTALDLSPRMLSRLRRRRDAEGLELTIEEGDVAKHVPEAPYDVVVANYFLNLFAPREATAMLEHLQRLVRPDGWLWFADFAPASGDRLGRGLTRAYYTPLNLAAWLLGLCARHPIPDYPALLAAVGMELVDCERFPVVFGPDPAYWAIAGRRRA